MKSFTVKERQDGSLQYKFVLEEWSLGHWDSFTVFIPEGGEASMHELESWGESSGKEIEEEEVYKEVLREATEKYGGEEQRIEVREGLREVLEAFGFEEEFGELIYLPEEEEECGPQTLEAMREAGYTLAEGCHSLEDAKIQKYGEIWFKGKFKGKKRRLWKWDKMHEDHYDVLRPDGTYIKITPEGEVLGEPKQSTIPYSKVA